MNTHERLMVMLEQTARALGPEILRTSAFVGGCVVGLLITDDFTREQVRATDDVDLIVDVLNFAAYARLADELKANGFKESMRDDIYCRWRLGELIVDVMPTEEKILGFSNIWYRSAIESAIWFTLRDGNQIRVVSPPYFIATKIEAFKGRGNDDYLTSRDVEDIITLVDGREQIVEEIDSVGGALKDYVSKEVQKFLDANDFEYAVESAVRSDGARAEIIFDRFSAIASK
jgi:predicted nucleotidyltransferase